VLIKEGSKRVRTKKTRPDEGRRDYNANSRDPEKSEHGQKVSPESMNLDLEQVRLMMRAHDESSLETKRTSSVPSLKPSKWEARFDSQLR